MRLERDSKMSVFSTIQNRKFRTGIQLLASPTKMSDFERGSEQVFNPSKNTAAREPDQNERF